MKIARNAPRSIRYSLFVGLLAGSLFSGQGAYGIDLSSIAADVANNNNITLVADANYEAGDPSNSPFLGTTYFGSYSGTFSGNGATISGLTVPLFDHINGSVSDLNLETAEEGLVGQGMLSNSAGPESIIDNVSATGLIESSSNNTGGLVGESQGALTNSSTSGTISSSGSYVGGLVGYSAGQISQSASSMSVTGQNNVGGLVGWSESDVTDSHAIGDVEGISNVGGLVGKSYGDVTDSHATGNVTGSGEYIGGFIGDAYGTIEDSFATGDVTGTGEFEHGVGGFAGYLSGSLINTYATGNVTGIDEVGGLVGSTGIAADVSITNSYATGNVTGIDYVGGLVGQLDYNHTITGSYARGYVTGDDSVGGLVGSAESGSLISNSYAKGNVTGNDDIGGLVGDLGVDAEVTNSYATGHVIGNVGEDGGDAGGLVGLSDGMISNSHASGDISGFYDVGGLVGDLQSSGSIRNSYATGNVRATGTDGDWSNGWGGLVGESSGLISNSYATGNVVADYNFGSLIGYLMINMDLEAQILNSFATGSTSRANNVVRIYETVYDPDSETYSEVDLDLDGLGGFVGCSIEGGFGSYSCNPDSYKTFPETTPSLLSVVNTEGTAGAPAFEIVACKNNGLPSLSELIDSYENTCVTLSGSNRERRIRDFIQTTAITEIAKTLGFVISSKFPNDAPIGFIKSEKDLAISKLLGLQKAADRVARTFVKTGEALQISYDSGGKEPIELWVKLADGKWILAGVINFDKNGKAVMPPIQFKVAGEYVVALNKPSEDSVKTNAPLNQIGSLTVIVN